MNKFELLKSVKFGQRIAEDEAEELAKYFVSTEDWRRLFENEIDIIYGAKGAGKSALYAILDSKKLDLFEKDVLLATAENPRGNTVFEGLTASPPTSEIEFMRLWKLYFLIITVSVFKEWRVDKENKKFLKIKNILEEANLIPMHKGLKSILKACRDYIKNMSNIEALQSGIDLNDALGPSGISLKVLFREPSVNEQKNGSWSLGSLYDLLEESLSEIGFSLWIAVDRLDVAFSENIELETNALRALFKVYRDLVPYSQIKIKIFLRDDIWRRITAQGFREASHITKTLTISWNKTSLLNLIIQRLLNNKNVIDEFQINREAVLDNYDEQENLFYRIFPEQIDIGDKKPKTMDWLISRVRDGNNTVAPREIIHFLNESQQQQISRFQIGQDELEEELLVGRTAFKSAMDTVSKVRIEQTLYAEYPDFKIYIQKLEGQKTEHNIKSLSSIWNLDAEQTTAIARSLSEIGFFEEKGNLHNPRFWIPFLYRNGLKLIQGSAT